MCITSYLFFLVNVMLKHGQGLFHLYHHIKFVQDSTVSLCTHGVDNQMRRKKEREGRKKYMVCTLRLQSFWWHLNKLKRNERTCLKFCIEDGIHSCAIMLGIKKRKVCGCDGESAVCSPSIPFSWQDQGSPVPSANRCEQRR